MIGAGLAWMNEGPFTMISGEALVPDRFVVLSGGEGKYAHVGQEPIGITTGKPVATKTPVACEFLKGEIRKVTGSKALSANADLYVADDGKVSDAIFGKQIGILIEAITGDGGIAAALIWGPRSGSSIFMQDGATKFRIHDHFTSGNVETGNKFSETADLAVWLKTSTDGSAGTSDVCIVADDGPGGLWELTCNAANADQENVQMNGESVKLAIGKKVFYETSIAIKVVVGCDWFVGLAIADVDILGGVTDRVGFECLHDASIDALVEQDGTESLSDTNVNVADCSAIGNFTSKKVRLSFFWDGVDSVFFYVDGVLKVTKTDDDSVILIPDDETLSPVYQIHTEDSAAAVQTMWTDYITIEGEI